MRTTFSNQGNPGAALMAASAKIPGRMKAALRQSAEILHEKRLAILDETIYSRGAMGKKPLTGNLRESEYVRVTGDTVVVGNTATYAHRVDSQEDWTDRAVRETEAERKAVMAAALNETLQGR